MALDVAVLVSVGCHPASGRARRALSDARALETALRLPGEVRIHLIHAGDPDEAILRDYLGMGVKEITVLSAPKGSDVLPALLGHLEQLKPDLILSGTHAEQGTSSGYLPYAIASALHYPIVPAAASVEISEGVARIAQALPRGKRRGVTAKLPLIATVDKAAATPRQSAYGLGRRGQIVTRESTDTPIVTPTWEERPARKRPKRLKVMAGGSAADRLKAASQLQAGKGTLMANPDPDDAARAIYAYLVEEGILKQ